MLDKKGITNKGFCNICGKDFATKYSLKTHKINIHGAKTFSESLKGSSASKDKQKDNQKAEKKSEQIEELPVELASIQKDIFSCLAKIKTDKISVK